MGQRGGSQLLQRLVEVEFAEGQSGEPGGRKAVPGPEEVGGKRTARGLGDAARDSRPQASVIGVRIEDPGGEQKESRWRPSGGGRR